MTIRGSAYVQLAGMLCSFGVCVAGAVAFGYWQGSWSAGLFMFCALDLLSGRRQ